MVRKSVFSLSRHNLADSVIESPGSSVWPLGPVFLGLSSALISSKASYWSLPPFLPPNRSKEGLFHRISPLAIGVPPAKVIPPWRHHLSRGHHFSPCNIRSGTGQIWLFQCLSYYGDSCRCHPYFPVVQSIGLQYSVLHPPTWKLETWKLGNSETR